VLSAFHVLPSFCGKTHSLASPLFGGQASDTNIYRILTDPSAKGIYYFNRFRQTGTWGTELKPENEWGKIECDPIVPETLWNQVNQIIEEQQASWKRPGKPPVHVFGSLLHCACGHKMYMRPKYPKYLCRKCHNKISVDELEGIFHKEMKTYFAQPDRIAEHLKAASKNLAGKETLLTAHEREIQKVREQMTRTHQLYVEGQITAQGFGQFYKPAEERLNQLTAALPKLQAEVDFLKVNKVSATEVLHEATTLHDRWPTLPSEDKRKTAEALAEQIVIGEAEIDIKWTWRPTSEELCKTQQRLGLG
jgi:site-specific DNA recombinase